MLHVFIKPPLIGFVTNNLPSLRARDVAERPSARSNHLSNRQTDLRNESSQRAHARHTPASCSTLCTNTPDYTQIEKAVRKSAVRGLNSSQLTQNCQDQTPVSVFKIIQFFLLCEEHQAQGQQSYICTIHFIAWPNGRRQKGTDNNCKS